MIGFGRTFRYEERANEALQKARNEWTNIEDILAAIEWGDHARSFDWLFVE